MRPAFVRAAALVALVVAPIAAQGPVANQRRTGPLVGSRQDARRRPARRAADGKRGLSQGRCLCRRAVRADRAEAGRSEGLSADACASYRRRILEEQSQLALVRDGKRGRAALRGRRTVNLRAELAPSVEAPLVFAGYGLSAPDAGHDDLAGLDLAGKVVVYIAGTPGTITGALAAHYQQAGVRWQALKAAGAIGSIAIANPKTVEQPWERTAPSRLNPVMTLVDPRFNDLAGMKVGAAVNPASAERLFTGSGHSFADLLAIADARRPLPRFALPASLRARVTLESTPIESDNVVALLPGGDPALAARARRADRAPRSRRGRRRGQRRSHLQRRHGQCLRHRDADRSRAHLAAPRRGRSGRSSSSPSPPRSTACSARATSPASRPSRKRASSPTSTWTCSCRSSR